MQNKDSFIEERTQVAAALAFSAEGHQLSAVSGAQVRLPEVEQFLLSLEFCPPGGMREHGEVFSCTQLTPLRSTL